MFRVLLLSPHRDDEVLGCGGTLDKLSKANVCIFYFNSVHPGVSSSTYDAEAWKLQERLGCEVRYSAYQKVNKLDVFPISNYITEIENTINDFKPDTLLIPFPSYNQDHRVVFEAAITASRPHDINHYVKNVLVYEQPETIQTNRLEPRFVPHVFMPININKKLELYKIYLSQQREHRSTVHIISLAALRGSQCNRPYAEAFMTVRVTAQ